MKRTKDATLAAAACACQGLALIEIANENLFLLRTTVILSPTVLTLPQTAGNVSFVELMENRQLSQRKGGWGKSDHTPHIPALGDKAHIVLKFN